VISCVNQAWSFYLISDLPNRPDESLTLRKIERHKSKLEISIEPNFGLIAQLGSLSVLSQPQTETVTSKQTTTDRNKQILEYLCEMRWTDAVAFMIALMVNYQEHVVNYILDKAGDVGIMYFMQFNNLFASFTVYSLAKDNSEEDNTRKVVLFAIEFVRIL
jgi:hypothetical protein